MIDGEALGRILAGEIIPIVVGLWFGWRFFTSKKQKKALRKMFGIDALRKLIEVENDQAEDGRAAKEKAR